MITQDANNRFVTDTEKSTWNGKQDKLIAGSNVTIGADGKTISTKDTTYGVATQSTNGLMGSADKTKLDNINISGIKVSTTGDFTTSTLPSGYIGFVLE